jgi:NifB/MoaA-like Fe-S oxidoreductase
MKSSKVKSEFKDNLCALTEYQNDLMVEFNEETTTRFEHDPNCYINYKEMQNQQK